MKWTFEPGHAAVEFRGAMVTWVRGHFKNVKGTIEFDPNDPAQRLSSMPPSCGPESASASSPHERRLPGCRPSSTDFFQETSVQQVGASHPACWNLTIRSVTRPIAAASERCGRPPRR